MPLYFLCHLLVVIALTGFARADDCPSGWFLHESTVTCLRLVRTGSTWSQARRKCQQLGGDLVKVKDAAMNTFIKDRLSSDMENWWIGLKKSGSNYLWLNETTTAEYTNFDLSIYSVSEVRDCAVLSRSPGNWHRESCSTSRPYVCQNPNNVIYCGEYLQQAEWPTCEINMKRDHKYKSCITDRTQNVLGYYGKSVLCDTVTDDGGWILFHRRNTKELSFNRNWTEYKNGFGSLDGEFWLGLELVHRITSQCQWELRIDMVSERIDYHAVYSSFKLENETQFYTIRLGPMLQNRSKPGVRDEFLNPENDMNMINNRRFSTNDVDNDSNDPRANYNCSQYYGPWWHNFCAAGFFNFDDFMGWISVNGIQPVGAWYGMESAELKIRKVNE